MIKATPIQISMAILVLLGSTMAYSQVSSRTPDNPEIEEIEEIANEDGQSIKSVGRSGFAGVPPEFGVPAIDSINFGGLKRTLRTLEQAKLETSTEARSLLAVLVPGNLVVRKALLQVKETLIQKNINSYELEREKSLNLIKGFCKKEVSVPHLQSVVESLGKFQTIDDCNAFELEAEKVACQKMVTNQSPMLMISTNSLPSGNCLLEEGDLTAFRALETQKDVIEFHSSLYDVEMILTFGVLMDFHHLIKGAEARIRGSLLRLRDQKIKSAWDAIESDHFLPQEKKDYEKELISKLVLTLEKRRIEDRLESFEANKKEADTLRLVNEKLYQELVDHVESKKMELCSDKKNGVFRLFGLIGNSKRKCQKRVEKQFKDQLRALNPNRGGNS